MNQERPSDKMEIIRYVLMASALVAITASAKAILDTSIYNFLPHTNLSLETVNQSLSKLNENILGNIAIILGSVELLCVSMGKGIIKFSKWIDSRDMVSTIDLLKDSTKDILKKCLILPLKFILNKDKLFHVWAGFTFVSFLALHIATMLGKIDPVIMDGVLKNGKELNDFIHLKYLAFALISSVSLSLLTTTFIRNVYE